MAKKVRARPVSRSRGVHYCYVVPRELDDEFNESDMEALLQRAREAGTVTQFDTGRGRIVWFEGAPGAAMRELRYKVLALLPETFRAQAPEFVSASKHP